MSNAVILMQSRSGSSMVAGIFAAHGFWYGESYDKAGYPTFENVDVKDAIKANKDKITRGEFCQPFDPCFYPEYEPWFWKGPVEVYPCFENFGAQTILVRRNARANVDALMARHPGGDRDYARSLYVKRHNLMDEVGGIDVYSDEIIAGDYTSIKLALNACDVEFNPELAKSVIRPDMWHHSA